MRGKACQITRWDIFPKRFTRSTRRLGRMTISEKSTRRRSLWGDHFKVRKNELDREKALDGDVQGLFAY